MPGARLLSTYDVELVNVEARNTNEEPVDLSIQKDVSLFDESVQMRFTWVDEFAVAIKELGAVGA